MAERKTTEAATLAVPKWRPYLVGPHPRYPGPSDHPVLAQELLDAAGAQAQVVSPRAQHFGEHATSLGSTFAGVVDGRIARLKADPAARTPSRGHRDRGRWITHSSCWNALDGNRTRAVRHNFG
jgi:hypothetical protein